MKNLLLIILSLLVFVTVLSANDKVDLAKFETIKYHKELKTPFIIKGELAEPTKREQDVKKVFLKKMAKLTGIKNLENSARKLDSFVDENGTTHYKMQQLYKGVKIRGAEFYIQTNENKVVGFTGKLMPQIKLEINKHLDKETIVNIALEDLKDDNKVQEIKTEKMIYRDEKGRYHLTFKVDLTGDKFAWITYVDAINGEIILSYNNIQNIQKTSYYDGIVDVDMNGSQYYDPTRNTWIQYSSGTKYSEGSNTTQNEKCVQALWGIEKTIDFYEQTFNRDSWDGNGDSVPIVYDPNESAYFYNGKITIGDMPGDSNFGYAGAIDVIAHEFSHGFCQYSSNLEYYGESGALNEANSDIIGNSVDRWVNNDNSWLVGEDIMNSSYDCLRSMKNPSGDGAYNTQQPKYYSERYTGTSDNGGVHINNSLGNKFFQMLVDGGDWYSQNNNTVSVEGLGDNKALTIWYRAVNTKFTSTTDYFEARDLVILAAEELYGASSNEVDQVKNAWASVGIGLPADSSSNDDSNDTFEPNDSIADAYTVENGSNYDSYIYASGDVDYYKFVTSESGILDLSLGNLPADYDMYLYDSSSSELAKAYTTNNPETISHEIIAGTYYIKVNGYNNANSNTSAYNLSVQFTGNGGGSNNDPVDPFEPNNTVAEAYQISSGNTYESYLYESGDIDYYKFTVSNSGTVNLELGNLPADYDMYLYDSGNTELAKAYTTNNPETISHDIAAGTYYVKVNGYNSAFDSGNMYYLTMNFTADGGGSSSEPQWYTINLSTAEETPHPYANNQTYLYEYQKSGAQKVAVHFAQFNFESNYDFVKTYDSNGTNINTYSGEKNSFWTQVDGDYIKIEGTSDYSYTYFGYEIDQVAYYSDTQLGIMPSETMDSLDDLKENAEIKIKGLTLSNYPNPFTNNTLGSQRSRGTTISYSIPKDSDVNLKVYNVKGQLVKTLVDSEVQAGSHEIKWNGKDNNGNNTGSGIYFYKLETEKHSLINKLIIIK